MHNLPIRYKLWSTLKSAVFGTNTSLPPLIGGGGCGLVCNPGAEAALFANHFDGANEVYAVAQCQFRDDCKDILVNAQSSHKI